MENAKKRITTLILVAAFLVLFMTGCGKTLSLSMGETVVLGEQVELTPMNALVSSRVFPPVWSDQPMGWVAAGEKTTYLTVVAKVKNLQDDEILVNTLWQSCTLSLKTEQVDYDIVAIVSDDGTRLDDGAKIKPGKTELVYFIKEIEEIDCQEQMEAVFAFKGAPEARVAFDGNSSIANWKPLKLKTPIKIGKVGTVSVMKVHFADQVNPDNPGYIYDYYAPKSRDEKLLIVEATVTNTSKKKQSVHEYLNLVAFADGYEYYGDLLSQSRDSARLISDGTLKPKEDRQVYGAISVPKDLKMQDLDVYVYLDGSYYRK